MFVMNCGSSLPPNVWKSSPHSGMMIGLPVARKAAAHAEIFNVLADAAGDPFAGSVLNSGVGLAYDMMIAAGRAADGMIASSRERFLAHLRAAELEEAALEMEKHL